MATPGGRQQRPAVERSLPAGGRVLLVGQDPLLLHALRRILETDGHETLLCKTGQESLVELARSDLDVALLDLELGLDLLEVVKRERPDVETVAITGSGSVEDAVQCMRLGAFDYLAQPLADPQRVRSCVRSALAQRRRFGHAPGASEVLDAAEPRFGLVGRSAGMLRLLRTVQALADNESHVLLRGESGTGKEMVAKAIHASSGRRGASFAPVDCGALPEGIVESELFGHERGAFTGALGAPGLLRAAHGGTLFLDEIGEMPLRIQTKLLRALQEKRIRPVGAARSQAVDVRVIAATHRDLDAMVAEGSFRADLFYRLDVVRIEIPPLRERPEDIPLLVQHFLAKHARRGASMRGIESAALQTLIDADWPGNVRELENVVESSLALAQGVQLRVADLPRARRLRAFPAAPAEIPLSLAAYERCALERALAEAGGDASEAARRLGLARSTLYRKLSRHGLHPSGTRSEGAGGPGSG